MEQFRDDRLGARALLDLIESAQPALYHAFARLRPLLGTPAEAGAVAKLYAQLGEVNFSHQVLALRPKKLAVVKVTGVRWSDLGEPRRVMASLDRAGVRPRWVDAAAPHPA